MEREKRITSSTGGEKGQKKQAMGLLPYRALMKISEVYFFGAQKYAAHNWRKGYDWSLSFDALQRHLALWWEGEDVDEESGMPHLWHAGFHILGLIEFSLHKKYKKFDDRYKP